MSDTTENPLKELPFPEARELGETLLIQQEIHLSYRTLKLWAEKYCGGGDLSEEDFIVRGSLFRDAVVQFVACFGRAEYKLSVEEVYREQIGNGALEYFQWMQDLRDAYAAHNFGPLRQCVVGAIFVPSEPVFMMGTGHMSNVYVSAEKSGAPQLLGFVGVAGRYIDAKVKKLEQKVLDMAQAMSFEELNALPNIRVYGVHPQEIRMSRPKFQKKRRANPTGL